ncbi:MAG: UDP-N-acetylmuramate--L-alanine ligase [Cyanobacteria bacterium J06648_16]
MLNSVDFSGRPFHFIGVGGIGMSALAYVLARRQLPVFGSDLRLSHITQRLKENGVQIFWNQAGANIAYVADAAGQLPQVVCSTAISESNAEYKAAVELGCPIFHRSDILAALMAQYEGIAVAGTHGKTTTSSLLGYLLVKAGIDPTVVIGGEVAELGGNAYVGQGTALVAEADESDGSLVKLSAKIGIITNVELDHPDHYSSLDQVVAIFETFSRQCDITVGCVDCPTVRSQLSPTVSYSLDASSGADYIATNIHQSAQGTQATIWERGQQLGPMQLGLLGLHNLSNALAVVAVARLLGLEFSTIANLMPGFVGARRRFDRRGFHNQILFVDDYAHHPSEIKVTLAAAKLQSTEPLPSGLERRVVAVFQPHRYSRTVALLQEFVTAFGDADRVIVTDIYAAGETNEAGMSGQNVADALAEHHTQVEYAATLEMVQARLIETLQPGDIAIFLTAGNLNRILPEVMAAHANRPQSQPTVELLSSV